ncbi:MAG: extracellular solute-binding protein, partial [Caldilineaceae bacterium]
IYGGDVMVTRSTREAELASWLFVKWFTEPDIPAQWVEASGYFPTRASTSEVITDFLAENTQFASAVDLLPFTTSEPQFISYTAVRDEMLKAFNEIMQGAPIQERLDALNEFANEQQATMMSELE